MKLITRNTDLAYLHSLKGLLEASGIPAKVNGEDTARMILVTEPSLWIYLDEQEDEARQLIEDPDYEVQHGVDVEEFYRIAETMSDNPNNLVETFLNWAMGIVLLSIILIVLVSIF